MMKIIKASEEQKRQYQAQDLEPIYPLFGYIVIDDMHCPVERCGTKRDEPNYECIAPEGKMFDVEGGLRSVLGVTQKDLLDRLQLAKIIDDPEDQDPFEGLDWGWTK